MRGKTVRGKHELVTVQFTVEVRGTAESVYDFGLSLLNIQGEGVSNRVVGSELITEKEEEDEG